MLLRQYDIAGKINEDDPTIFPEYLKGAKSV